jgi:hypothetical protein
MKITAAIPLDQFPFDGIVHICKGNDAPRIWLSSALTLQHVALFRQPVGHGETGDGQYAAWPVRTYAALPGTGPKRPTVRQWTESPDGRRMAVVQSNGSLALFSQSPPTNLSASPTQRPRRRQESKDRGTNQPFVDRSAYLPWSPTVLKDIQGVKFAGWLNDTTLIIADSTHGLYELDLASIKRGRVHLDSRQAEYVVYANDSVYMVEGMGVYDTGSKTQIYASQSLRVLDGDGDHLLVLSEERTLLDFYRNTLSKTWDVGHLSEPIIGASISQKNVATAHSMLDYDTGTLEHHLEGELIVACHAIEALTVKIVRSSDGSLKMHIDGGDASEWSNVPEELVDLRRDVLANSCSRQHYHPSLYDPAESAFTRHGLELILLEGSRCIRLTDTSLKALHFVAQAGPAGLVQADLCRALQLDTKTTFHHLKPLNAQSLVRKHSVAHNRTHTHKFTWVGFGASSEGSAVADLDEGDTSFRDVILKHVPTAPSRLPLNELIHVAKIGREKVKSFRRALKSLQDKQLIERIEEGGVKYVRKVANAPCNKAAQVPSSPVNRSTLTSHPLPSLPSLYEMIVQAASSGVTTKDISDRFQVDFKRIHRVMERLLADYPDVTKRTEFVGRERRNRYIQSSFQGDDSQALKAQSQLKKESVSVQDRQLALMALLKEESAGILEVDRQLASSISEQLGSSFTMDLKTLKRTITLLEDAQLVCTARVKIAGLNRLLDKSLVMRPDKTHSDVQAFVQAKQERLMQAKRAATDDQPEAAEEEEQESADLIPVDKFAMGFKAGSYCRARMLHEFLLAKTDDHGRVVDLRQYLYRELTVALYCSLIGLQQSTQPVIDDLLLNEGRSPIFAFPELKTDTKFRNVLARLIRILEEDVQCCQRWPDEPALIPPSLTMTTFKDGQDSNQGWEDFRARTISQHPNRWLERPLPSKERRHLKRQLSVGEATRRQPNDESEEADVGEDQLHGKTEIKRRRNLQPLSEHVPTDDQLLIIAFLLGYLHHADYSEYLQGRSSMPYQLIAEALCQPRDGPLANTEQEQRELRRRLKVISGNHEKLHDLKILELKMMAVTNLVRYKILPGPPIRHDGNMVAQFRELVAFYHSQIDDWQTLQEVVIKAHHERLLSKLGDQVADAAKLKPLYALPDYQPLHALIEPEGGKTRTELEQDYMRLPYTRCASMVPEEHPPGFDQLRRLIMRGEGGTVDAKALEYAMQRGYLKSESRGPLMYNNREATFGPGKDVYYDFEAFWQDLEARETIAVRDLDEVVEDVDTLEGLLVGLAVGDVIVHDLDNPGEASLSISIDKKADNWEEQTLKYSFLTGRHAMLSQRERHDLLRHLPTAQQ